MRNRVATFLCIIILGLTLGGCSKCGWLWDDYGPRACHADAPKR